MVAFLLDVVSAFSRDIHIISQSTKNLAILCIEQYSIYCARIDTHFFSPNVHRRDVTAWYFSTRVRRTLIPVAVTFNDGNSSDQNRETWRHEA